MHELILQENYLLVQLFIFNLIYIAFPAPRVPPARVFETPWAPGISPSEDATRSPKKCKRKENMMNPFQRSREIFNPSSILCNSASSKLPSFSINLVSEMERT